MSRVKDENINVMEPRWASQFAPSAGTLGDVERYWVSRGYELTRCQPDYDIHYTINNWTNGLVDDWSAVFVVDSDGERLAVYGYDGSYPYTMNEDDWVERIDGNRLPKRETHVVLTMTGEQAPNVRVYYGDDLELVVDMLVDQLFYIDWIDYDLEQREDEDIAAELMRLSVQLNTLTIGESYTQSATDITFSLTACDCAGHEYIAHYE